MRGRNLLIAAAVLVVLVLMAIFIMKEPPPEQITASFPEIKKDQVTKVWIRTPVKDEKDKNKKKDKAKKEPARFEEVTLEKEGQGESAKWMVTLPVRYEAYQSYIDTMLSRLEELKIDAIAAESKVSYEDLEIDADHATEVKVFKGGSQILHFIVGGYKGGATMVRFPKDDKVYRVRGSIGYLFAKPVRDWREKRILNIENDQVTRLEFSDPSGAFAFSKVENNWKNESATAISDYDSKKISGFVSTVAHLRATDFEDTLKPEQAGLGEGAASVTLYYTEKTDKDKNKPDAKTEPDVKGGGAAAAGAETEAVEASPARSETILVGSKKDDSNYYIMMKGGSQIFLISKYTAERLTPTADKFATPPKKETPKTAEGTAPKPDASTDAASIPPDVMKKIQAEIKKQQLMKQLAGQKK
jgi:hypothetical protein